MYAVIALEVSSHANRDAPTEDSPQPEAESSPGLLLHYHIPQHLNGDIEPGQLVAVPLRGKPAYGVVVEMSATSPVEATLTLTRLVDTRPMVSPAMLALA